MNDGLTPQQRAQVTHLVDQTLARLRESKRRQALAGLRPLVNGETGGAGGAVTNEVHRFDRAKEDEANAVQWANGVLSDERPRLGERLIEGMTRYRDQLRKERESGGAS